MTSPRRSSWWGLSRTQTIIALGSAVVIGIVMALLLPRSGKPPPVAATSAVWVFGFATVRADPALRHAEIVHTVGFGAVAGATGRVYLYDPGTGRLGYLDAAHNQLHELPRAPHGSSVPGVATPLVAVGSRRVWLVPSPDRLVEYDTSSRRVERTIPLPTAHGVPRRTAVVATGRRVIAVSESSDRVTLTQVDRRRGVVTRTRDLPGSHVDPQLLGVAGTDQLLWTVTPGSAMAIDPATLRVHTTMALAANDASAGGAAAAGTHCYVLRSNSGVVSLSPSGDERVVVDLQHPADAPPTPAAIAVGDGRVYALVPVGSGPDDHRSRLTGARLPSGADTRSVQLPASLFAGGLALSSASP
ncbi:MAG TPA: hypothetical protein VGN51_16070 [Acidimicrobiia bacterium]|jgi:hypothetical protein